MKKISVLEILWKIDNGYFKGLLSKDIFHNWLKGFSKDLIFFKPVDILNLEMPNSDKLRVLCSFISDENRRVLFSYTWARRTFPIYGINYKEALELECCLGAWWKWKEDNSYPIQENISQAEELAFNSFTEGDLIVANTAWAVAAVARNYSSGDAFWKTAIFAAEAIGRGEKDKVNKEFQKQINELIAFFRKED